MPSYTQPYSQPAYSQQGVSSTTGQAYAAQPQSVQQYDNQYPATQSVPAQPGPIYGNQQPGPQPSVPCPYNAAGALPPPDRPVQPIIPPDSPFSASTPDQQCYPIVAYERVNRGNADGPIDVRRGRQLRRWPVLPFIFNEQNFAWFRLPTVRKIKNVTAWRGAGQRFRLEAVPGKQVSAVFGNVSKSRTRSVRQVQPWLKRVIISTDFTTNLKSGNRRPYRLRIPVHSRSFRKPRLSPRQRMCISNVIDVSIPCSGGGQ